MKTWTTPPNPSAAPVRGRSTPRRGRRAPPPAWALLALGVACGQAHDDGVAGPAPAGAPTATAEASGAGAPFDLGAVIDRVRFGFRAEAGRHVGGHASYAVAVEGGRIEVTPLAPARGEPLTLETVHAGRAGAGAVTGAAARVADDGHLAIHRSGVIEELRNGERGVEQSWAFAAAPRGAGPLVVRVRAEGLDFRGATEGGLHFAGDGGRGLRYGHGTWIGADGARSAVPAAWDGAAIVLSVPADVIARTAYPARLDPVVEPEIDIDEPVTGPADGEQVHASVAFDGTSWLVAWGGDTIRATRVTPAGLVLDPQGITIEAEHGPALRPSVASNGGGFLVVWTGTDPDFFNYEVRGARINAAGAVLDPMGFVIASDPSADSERPAVDAAGAGYLVAYEEYGVILGKRVSAGGQVLDPTAIELSDPFLYAEAAAVAASDTEYLVLWSQIPDSELNVHGVFVSSGGAVDDPAGLAIAPAAAEQTSAGAAWNGTSWLVVWEQAAGALPSVRGARVSAGHQVLDAGGFVVSAGALGKERPVVAASAAEWFVAFDRVRTQVIGGTTHDFFQIFGTKVSAGGFVLSPNGDPLAAEREQPQHLAIAGGASGYLLAWEQAFEQGDFSRVHATRLDVGGAVLDPQELVLALGANAELEPAVASNGTSYLVVWSDRRNGAGDTDIWGVLVDPTGAPLTPSGIGVGVTPGQQLVPRVASNGDGFLVVWANDTSLPVLLSGNVVAADGTVADASGFEVAASGFNAGVASNGTDYLVVWDEFGGATDQDIRAARVAADGTLLDPTGFAISEEPYVDWTPSVASNGTDYLVVWEEDYFNLSDVTGARVAADGTVLDPTGFAIAEGDVDYQFSPAVASNGTDYYVVWAHSGGAPPEIRGTNVGADGAVLAAGGKVLGAAAATQLYPAVASDGTGYIAVWHDDRSGEVEIYGSWVTPQGGILEPFGVAIDEDSEPIGDEPPSIAAAAAGNWLVVYSEHDPSPGVGAPRVHGHFITGDVGALPDGAPCASAGLCASGFCTDGVCCDQACGGGDQADCQACSVATGATADGTCSPAGAGKVCGIGGGACDIPESCDGVSLECPPDASAPDGEPCDDGDACTEDDVCLGGACAGGIPLDCEGGECRIGLCSEGTCQSIEADDGTPCSAGECLDGECVELSGAGATTGTGTPRGPLAAGGGGGCRVAAGPRGGDGAVAAALALALGAAAGRRRPRRATSPGPRAPRPPPR